ncbi:MAG: nickel-dependent hydrogenase large subunit [Chitinophagales bacterium]
MSRIVIDPLNRQNGVTRVEVELAGGRVVEARITNPNLKGFELLLLGRDPNDAPFFSERICGICSSVHAMAASLALEDAYGASPPHNGLLLRNLILGADLLQNHIRHFYLLSLPDWAPLPDRPPLTPRYRLSEQRFTAAEVERLTRNYERGIVAGQQAHALVVVFGTRAPHQQAMLAGGVATRPRAELVAQATALLADLRRFIAEALVPDTELLASRHAEYFDLGRSQGNLLSYGMFPRPGADGERYYPPGVLLGGQREKLDPSQIAEDLTNAWYRNPTGEPQPPLKGRTDPADDLSRGYSFTKAPRYRGEPMEGGPLARAWLRGDYRRGLGAMDRILARSYEARQVAEWMNEWLHDLKVEEPAYEPPKVVRKGTGVGLHDAFRGPLGHWLKIRGGRLVHYQIITPSAWELSPRDGRGVRGPAEQALIGTEIADPENPVEIGRILRSFDPCSACSVQLLELDGRAFPPVAGPAGALRKAGGGEKA